MQILPTIDAFKIAQSYSLALTLGNFDGVHPGHQAVIERLLGAAKEQVLLTFSNHPGEILCGHAPPCLCTLKHKLALIEKKGVPTSIVIPFTTQLSLMTAEEFLKYLRKSIPFTHLILGHDALFGHKRDGTPVKLRQLAPKMGFTLDYVPPVLVDNKPLSSSRIRQCIEKGELDKAQKLLGRPYSIQGEILEGQGLGKKIGFPTANLKPSGLALLPYGVYGAKVLYRGKPFQAIANLGVGPTLRQDPSPVLEVHLFNHKNLLYKEQIEVIFHSFIRKERKFPTIRALQAQIQQDIQKIIL